jgi:xanthine/uracil permease
VLLLLGLLPVVGAVVAAIPYPVLGGAGIVLFGSVAASGIRTLSRVDYHDNLNMVIVSVAVAVGIIPIAAPDFWEAFPEWFGVIMHSGISATAIVAVVLNLLFNEISFGKKPGASVMAAAEAERDKLGDTLDDEMKGQQKPPVVVRRQGDGERPSSDH